MIGSPHWVLTINSGWFACRIQLSIFFRLYLLFYWFSHPFHREDVLQYMQIYRKRQCMDTRYHELSKRCISSSWKQSSAWECSSCYIIEEKNTYSSWLLGTGMCITLYSTLYAFIMLGRLCSCLQGVYILQTLQGVEKSLMPYSQVFMFFLQIWFSLRWVAFPQHAAVLNKLGRSQSCNFYLSIT